VAIPGAEGRWSITLFIEHVNSTMSRYRVLALTWRPKSFDEVVGQPHVVTSLSNAISLKKVPQCLLFTGTRGVGKTTIARILSKCLNCLDGPTSTPCQTCDHCTEIDAGRFPDLYEVDAASRTKVEDTRELLDNIPYAPCKGRFKVYLIDEVHMLSTHSFNALLKTLEEPPEHVVFLLATTDPQKLPATVLSRCLQFKLQSMSAEQIGSHIQHILQAEKIPFDPEACQLIAQSANGSMRDALSLLDQGIAHGNGEVKTASVREMLGTIDTQPLCELLASIADQDGKAVLTHVANLRRAGVDFLLALRELSALIQEIAVIQVIGSASKRESHPLIPELAKRFSATQTQLIYQIALKGIEDMPFSPTPELGFEMTLLRMLAFNPEQESVTAPAAAAPQRQPTSAAAPQRQPTSAAAPQRQSKPAAAQVTTPSPATNPVATANNTSDASWGKIIPQLQLRGLTLVLAQSCQLKEKGDNCWLFTLDKKQQPLLQKRTEQALTQALCAYLNKPISIRVDLSSDQPAAAATAPVQQKQPPASEAPPTQNPVSSAPEKAENPVHQDPDVQRIMQTFSGKLDDQRVVNNNNNN
jgi:DNA polymerase III subunit gamma/tau